MKPSFLDLFEDDDELIPGANLLSLGVFVLAVVTLVIALGARVF